MRQYLDAMRDVRVRDVAEGLVVVVAMGVILYCGTILGIMARDILDSVVRFP